MRRNILKKFSFCLVTALASVLMLVGCVQANGSRNGSENSTSLEPTVTGSPDLALPGIPNVSGEMSLEAEADTAELLVRFGDDGTPFTLHLYDNDTAAAIARHVGTADWRLPIYNYNDYENWEVMQYYDIPNRYEIPSNPQLVTKEQAGTVYYSDPNRIVLFFGDAEVTGEYTQVGYFEVTNEFVSAVENNPVVPGWNNKLVFISPKE